MSKPYSEESLNWLQENIDEARNNGVRAVDNLKRNQHFQGGGRWDDDVKLKMHALRAQASDDRRSRRADGQRAVGGIRQAGHYERAAAAELASQYFKESAGMQNVLSKNKVDNGLSPVGPKGVGKKGDPPPVAPPTTPAVGATPPNPPTANTQHGKDAPAPIEFGGGLGQPDPFDPNYNFNPNFNPYPSPSDSIAPPEEPVDLKGVEVADDTFADRRAALETGGEEIAKRMSNSRAAYEKAAGGLTPKDRNKKLKEELRSVVEGSDRNFKAYLGESRQARKDKYEKLNPIMKVYNSMVINGGIGDDAKYDADHDYTAKTPAASKSKTPTAPKAKTPTASKSKTPTASKAKTPTASKAKTPTASKAKTPTLPSLASKKSFLPRKSEGKPNRKSGESDASYQKRLLDYITSGNY